MFRKILIWIVKNILVLLLVAFIFSAAAFNLPGMIEGIFKDVFSMQALKRKKKS